MLNEAVLLSAQWGRHKDHGLYTLAQTIPRTVPGGQDDPPPDQVPIFTFKDSKTVAQSLIAPKVPAMIYWGDSSAPVKIGGYKRAREVVVVAAYVTDAGADDTRAVQQCGLYMRAGLLSYARYDIQSNTKTPAMDYRSLNGIHIHKVEDVTEQQLTANNGAQRLWGWLELRLIVVETLS